MGKTSSTADKMRHTALQHEVEALATDDPSRAKYLNKMAESIRALADAIQPSDADTLSEMLKRA